MSRLHELDGFDYHTGVVNCSTIDTAELVALKRKAYLRFYFGKGRILRTMMQHPDKRSLGGLAWKMFQRLDIGRALKPMHSGTAAGVSRPLGAASA